MLTTKVQCYKHNLNLFIYVVKQRSTVQSMKVRRPDCEQQKVMWLLLGQFLATLVALHFTPVSNSVSGQSFGLA